MALENYNARFPHSLNLNSSVVLSMKTYFQEKLTIVFKPKKHYYIC